MSVDSKSAAEDRPAAPSGLELADIYFVLFRRKWFMVFGLLAGVVVAGALWKMRSPLFESTAKLMVRYVRDSQSLASVGTGSQVKNLNPGGASIIATEGEILTSLDVATDAALRVGPQRILGAQTVSTNPLIAAAGVLQRNLKVETRVDVLVLHSQHADQQVAVDLLKAVITAYLKKHDQIHNEIGASEEGLTGEREQLRTDIANLEREINELKGRLGVFSSLDDFQKMNAAETSKLRQELFSTEADLAQRIATLTELGRVPTTNAVGPKRAAEVPPAKLKEYIALLSSIEGLQRREEQLLFTLTPANDVVKTNRIRLDELIRRKEQVEKEFPEVARGGAAVGPGSPLVPVAPGVDLQYQEAQIPGLVARRNAVSNQLAQVQAKAREVEESAVRIVRLQRDRDAFQARLNAIDRALQERQFNQVIGSANIQLLQSPSPPGQDFLALYKKMAMAVFGGLGCGVGLAFLLELVIDHSLRRPKDVETHLRVPLMVSIPALRLQRRGQLALGRGPEAGSALATRGPAAGPGGNAVTTPTVEEGEAKPYHDALRDRLMNYFERHGMTHKPKLIAVTSCGEGAGVSFISSGLAASLSETGDGNVLLVDMRGGSASVHGYFMGKPACDLAQVLEGGPRTNAMVQDNLYVVSGGAEQKLDRLIPRDFGNFIPKLKASDYDYIIFDMPPVAPTSITSKISRYMDMVLMVVESEKTDRQLAARAGALLAETNGKIATILNKRKHYVPGWLHREFE